MRTRHPFVFVAWFLLLVGFTRSSAAPAELYRETRRIMGTYCEVQAYHTDAATARMAISKALDEMQRVDRLLSNYDPNSELSAMNKAAGLAPVRVSEELFAFVQRCQDYVTATGGAFDPTVGPLVRAWGFFTPTPSRPSAAAIAAARAMSGFSKVRLNPAARTVQFTESGVEIDPGGIGKGLAVDLAADVLKKYGIRAGMVSAGGSTIYALGHPPDRPAWRVAIRDPANPETPLAIVALNNNSVSTSGVSEKFVQEGSRRFGHVFDPRTGEPVEGMCQASVIAPTAIGSDALTKAAFIRSRDEVRRQFEPEKKLFHAMRVEGSCKDGRVIWTTPWSAGVFVQQKTAAK